MFTGENWTQSMVGARTQISRIIDDSKVALKCVHKLIQLNKAFKKIIALFSFAMVLETIAPLLTPLIMSEIIDTVYPARDTRLLYFFLSLLVALQVINGSLHVLTSYLSTYLYRKLEYKMTLRFLASFYHMPLLFVRKNSQGFFLERMNGDITNVSNAAIHFLPQMSGIVFMFVTASIIMFKISPWVTVLILFVVPINYIINSILSGKLRTVGLVARNVDEKITAFEAESITGVICARIFNFIRYRRRKFSILLRERFSLGLQLWRTATYWGQLNSLVRGVWNVILLCGGWYLVFADKLQLGQAVALGMYIKVITAPFNKFAGLYQSLPRHEYPGITNAAHFNSPQHIKLENVTFCYNEKDKCVDNFNLAITRGQTIAMIGLNGSGKSTVLKLVAGLYDNFEGVITYNDVDIREIPKREYFKHLALVTNHEFFFNDTIIANLGNYEIDEIRPIAQELGIHSLINSLANGYETEIGSTGKLFSSGEYQKLAILRALLKKPKILLLDEMMSCTDIGSEKKLLAAIQMLKPPDCITLFATHRIKMTTEPWIDSIVIIEDGEISEIDCSRDLLQSSELYRDWLN